jgi:predicted O-linked N-acetylglucosamine transferase (SPINDLY family)
MLPPLHHAVIHDQLHPASPTAACAKLRARLIPQIGDAISRLRFLPPIDDNSFHVLRSHSIAVLDSYPVGMHLPILEAMAAGVPVVLPFTDNSLSSLTPCRSLLQAYKNAQIATLLASLTHCN